MRVPFSDSSEEILGGLRLGQLAKVSDKGRVLGHGRCRDVGRRLVVGGVEEDLTGGENGSLFPDRAATVLIAKAFSEAHRKHMDFRRGIIRDAIVVRRTKKYFLGDFVYT